MSRKAIPINNTVVLRNIFQLSDIGINLIPIQIKIRGHNLTKTHQLKEIMPSDLSIQRIPMEMNSIPQKKCLLFIFF